MLMPRARRGRGSLVPVKFQVQLALGAIAQDAGVIISTTAVLQQGFDIITTHLNLTLRGNTAGEGPIDVGIAAGQAYTIAEIIEALDASPLRASGVEMERSQRKVRLYGAFDGLATDEKMNDGLTIKRKMFMRGLIGQTPSQLWAVNRGPARTTGAIIECSGVHWGRWK